MTRPQLQASLPPGSTDMRAPSALLQRRCACGVHSAGGGECAECRKKKSGVQRKLLIGASNDTLELEADRIADQVMAASTRHAVGDSPLRVQRFGGQPHGVREDVPAGVDQVLASPGRPLAPPLLRDVEQRFGRDFSAVRVHTDTAAEQSASAINALAYTAGRDIVFDSRRFSPWSAQGRRLLAHELVHVVQQSPGDTGVIRRQPVDDAADTVGSRPAVRSTPAKKAICTNDRLTKEQYLEGITWLEQHRQITTEEAEHFRAHVPSSRRARCRHVEFLNRRAAQAREGFPSQRRAVGRTSLISNFKVKPGSIDVEQGEAARIEFDVTGTDIASITCMIIKYEFSEEKADLRNFVFHPTSGHKNAIWDGTFEGSRNKAPEPGTYRVRLWVNDSEGHHSEAFEQIRVVNRGGTTVLPRTQSGLALKSLEFDGHKAVLTDSAGNAIAANALSGLKPNNPHNPTRGDRHPIDYTDPKYKCEAGRGPIPPGKYFVDANTLQQPDLVRGKLKYPTGGGAAGWGPFRAVLRPANPSAVCNRSEFFFHLDVTTDGTAGCIGISASDEAKFNQMSALIMRIPAGSSLPVEVNYK